MKIWDLIILKHEVWRFENFKISRTQLIWVFFCSPRAVCRCLHFYRTFLVQSQSIYLINYDSFVLGCIFARSSTTALYELDLTSTLLAGSALKLLSPTEVFHLPYPHSSNTRRRITGVCSNVQVQLEPTHAVLGSAGTCLRGFVRSDLVAPCFLSWPAMLVTSSGNTSQRLAQMSEVDLNE